MRIFHVIGSLDPAAGGPPAVAARLAAAQAALGHEVRIVCLGQRDQRYEVNKSLAGVPHMDRVLIVALWPGAGWRAKVENFTGKLVAQYLQPRVEPGDILHLHGVWEPLLRSSAKVARHNRAGYALTPHGMLDPWSLQQSKWKKKLALLLGYRTMLQHAAFIHALNQDEATGLAPLHLRSPIEVIPNGVFLEEIDPLPEKGSFYQSHPQLQGRPYVLFLSRLHYKKGLDYLVDAFAQIAAKHPQLQLVVAGPDGGEKEPLERRLAELNLQNRALLTGPLYGRAKWEALVDATCFCLPSRQEGFSMAVTEAMAAGTPVVISRECHFPEVAQAQAGLVVSLNAGEVAIAIDQVVRDGNLARSMGQAGRNLVVTHYTWDRIAQQTLAAYERARGSSR